MPNSSESVVPLPLTVTSRIPPELYDAILDNLHLSKHSLSLCSTVCKSWLPSCRYHLFADVILRPGFIDFLNSSASPAGMAIASYIRNVTLSGATMSTPDYGVVLTILRRLENITELRLEFLTWALDGLDFSRTAVSVKPTGCLSKGLRKLDLRCIHFPSFAALASLVGRLTMLQEVLFDNVSWDANYTPIILSTAASDDPSSPLPNQMKKLQIVSSPNKSILSWFSSQGPQRILRLESLALPDILPEEVSNVGELLRIVSSSLEHLEVGFLMRESDVNVTQDIVDWVDLSSHTRLRSICIHQLILYQFPFAFNNISPPAADPPISNLNSSFSWIVPLILSISSSLLSEITFHVWLSAESQLDVIDWKSLSRILCRTAFSSLRRIKFVVSGIEEPTVEQWFEWRLRGIDFTIISLEIAFR